MKTVTTPNLEKALKALDEAEAECRQATAANRAVAARNGQGSVRKGGQHIARPANRDCQALTLGQPNKKWVRLNGQLRRRIGVTK